MTARHWPSGLSIKPPAHSDLTGDRYQDGSLLIVLRPPQSNVLRPPFNALETPSEVHMVAIYPLPVTVINLAWHAHVKSQFLGSLAVQTQCGDLEVWNVPKNPRESKKIRCKAIQWEDIRYPEGHHWMGWLKDGHLFHGSKRYAPSLSVDRRRLLNGA